MSDAATWLEGMHGMDGAVYDISVKNIPFHLDHLLQTIRYPEIASLV